MSGRLIYSPDAIEDIDGIWHYTLETWGLEQAIRYTDAIDACCTSIANGTTLTKPVTLERRTFGMCRCEHHRIYFLKDDDTRIVAVLHERSDLLTRLKERL